MKKIFLTSFAAVAVVAAVAQEGLNRRVEVIKSYTPEVGQAQKLPVAPRMDDTVTLRPDISYSIRPAAWQNAFGVKPIAAATIDALPAISQPFGYVRVGVGAPWRSLADAYFHRQGRNGYAGVYLNHSGTYAKIVNDMDQSAPATLSMNKLGAYGATNAGIRTQVGGTLEATYDFATRYGLTFPAMSSLVQSYAGATAGVWFGNDFSDLSFLNFRLGAGVATFGDRHDNRENGFDVWGKIGGKVGIGELSLAARADGRYGSGSMDEYKNTTFAVSPEYAFRGRTFLLSAELTIAADNLADETKVWVFPQVKIKWDMANGYFVPFAELSGSLGRNSLESLAHRNPYLAPGAISDKNTGCYKLRGGISGSFASQFSYNAYAGADVWRDRVTFGYIYSSDNAAAFTPLTQDFTQIVVGGDISMRVAGNFEATLRAQANFFPDNTDNKKAGEAPAYVVGFSVDYRPIERLKLSLGVDMLGARYFYGVAADGSAFVDVKSSPRPNITFKADYSINNRWGVFVQGDNLAGMKLYPYNHYCGTPLGALGGVSYRFR